MGKFQGGGAFNVIPDSVTIGGTFRALLKSSFVRLRQRIEEVRYRADHFTATIFKFFFFLLFCSPFSFHVGKMPIIGPYQCLVALEKGMCGLRGGHKGNGKFPHASYYSSDLIPLWNLGFLPLADPLINGLHDNKSFVVWLRNPSHKCYSNASDYARRF